MSTTSDFGYDYVFELASKLTPEEQTKLARRLEEPRREMKIVEETVSTGEPIFTPEELARFEKNRKELEASIDWSEETREKLLKLALECPVASGEEVEKQNEFRRLFRCRPS